MLIGWNRGYFFLITRALLVNQEGMITQSWLADRASAVSWFPAKIRWNEFWKSWERNATLLMQFWMQLFHQLWNKIGTRKWMRNCGIERGPFDFSFSTTQEKASSGRLKLHEEWKFMAAEFQRKILRFWQLASSDIQNRDHLIARK